MKTFENLGLDARLLNALRDAGYDAPTPIQERAVPPILEGRDVLGLAQTGTGKTAAFTLPMLHHLAANKSRPAARSARALVLTPTRELAAQVGDAVRTYGRHLQLRHAVIFGGIRQGPQVRATQRGVDVLIATPGRLMDLLKQGHLRLDSVDFFVLDEADRMLDLGFIQPIQKIASILPKTRQTLLFSATMPREIAGLAQKLQNDPVRVEAQRVSSTAPKIDQQVLFVDKANKRALLERILSDKTVERALVFTRTKRGADRVTRNLDKSGVEAAAIHGDKSQGARQSALKGFKRGTVRVLVATDIAARGIDIDGISHVINFDMPDTPEAYVHRIGRTARAGANGTALSMCDPSETGQLRDIERTIGQTVPIDAEHPFHQDDVATLASPPKNASARRGKGNRPAAKRRSAQNLNRAKSKPKRASDGRSPQTTGENSRQESKSAAGRRGNGKSSGETARRDANSGPIRFGDDFEKRARWEDADGTRKKVKSKGHRNSGRKTVEDRPATDSKSKANRSRRRSADTAGDGAGLNRMLSRSHRRRVSAASH